MPIHAGFGSPPTASGGGGAFSAEAFLVDTVAMNAKGAVAAAVFDFGRVLDAKEWVDWWWMETTQAFAGGVITFVGNGMGSNATGVELLNNGGTDMVSPIVVDDNGLHVIGNNVGVGNKGSANNDRAVWYGTGKTLGGQIQIYGGGTLDQLTTGAVKFHFIIGRAGE